MSAQEHGEHVAACVPVNGYAAELPWGLRDAGKDGARFELKRKKQASGVAAPGRLARPERKA